jgi:dihydrofolate synthase/folylpolyglutamate synthase
MEPLDFLFGLERLGMKFGLDNIAALCEALGHPERTFRAIVIAGTNGKGSVTVMVETALRAAGYRTARYTSPHLMRLEERFVIDGLEVETDALSAAVDAVRIAIERLVARGSLDGPPTFFECATAAAFELFRRAAVEVAVLEVGLGGRLDATNVVTPIATAITTIDFDHQAQLGNTLDAIAREKAGIIKPGVPVVCGRLPTEAEIAVRDVARQVGAPVIDALRAVQVTRAEDGSVRVQSRTMRLDAVTLALPGAHQLDNAAVAVALLDGLTDSGVDVPDEAVRTGLSKATWPGRLERFSRDGVDVLLDAAHNPAGARARVSSRGDRMAARHAALRSDGRQGRLGHSSDARAVLRLDCVHHRSQPSCAPGRRDRRTCPPDDFARRCDCRSSRRPEGRGRHGQTRRGGRLHLSHRAAA